MVEVAMIDDNLCVNIHRLIVDGWLNW